MLGGGDRVGLPGWGESELRRRVRAAVGASRAEHGLAGGAKWPVAGSNPENPDWEGGYVCHCGEVFAYSYADGGVHAAFAALVEHQGGRVVGEGPEGLGSDG
jgi:hypothetical protein